MKIRISKSFVLLVLLLNLLMMINLSLLLVSVIPKQWPNQVWPSENPIHHFQVFPFFADRPCNGFHEVLQRYNELTPNINKSGPTSFAPIIKETINIVKRNGKTMNICCLKCLEGAYHILIIIADGLVTSDTLSDKTESDTRAAIVEASKYALSILVIGVGDGPW